MGAVAGMRQDSGTAVVRKPPLEAKNYKLSCGCIKPIKNRGEFSDTIRCFNCGVMVQIGEQVEST